PARDDVVVPEFNEPVRVVALHPPLGAMNVPRDTPLWVEFDQYLDPDELGLVSTLRVGSKGVTASNRVQYEMVDKRVVALLFDPLEPGFQYDYTVNNGVIVSVTGAPMLAPHVSAFTTGEDFAGEVFVQNEPTWGDIAPILNEGCGCHTLETYPDPWFTIPALSYERLVGQPSQQRPELDLVDPYRPWKSYLMHKALPDYPDR